MNTLQTNPISQTLHKLHAQATDNRERFLSISPEHGTLLYFLASSNKARNIVEFGCSMGISAIYLAAAASENNGHVTTTDMDTSKYDQARQNMADAGLAQRITILQGDARQTLVDYDQSADLLFLDGAKDLYLPVFEIIQPKLSSRALIIADNMNRSETQPFLDYFTQVEPNATTAHLFDGRMLIAQRP